LYFRRKVRFINTALKEIKCQPESALRKLWHFLKFLKRQRGVEAWADVPLDKKDKQCHEQFVE